MTTPTAPHDDPWLWLEDVGGERALAWVHERNAESQAELATGNAVYAELQPRIRAALDAQPTRAQPARSGRQPRRDAVPAAAATVAASAVEPACRWINTPMNLPGPGTLSLAALHDPWVAQDEFADALLINYVDFITPDTLYLARAGSTADAAPAGTKPTLLYGYGGFEVSMQPWYSATWGRNQVRPGTPRSTGSDRHGRRR